MGCQTRAEWWDYCTMCPWFSQKRTCAASTAETTNLQKQVFISVFITLRQDQQRLNGVKSRKTKGKIAKLKENMHLQLSALFASIR